MKRLSLYIFIITLLFPAVNIFAQNTGKYSIRAEQPLIRRAGGKVIINTNLDISNLKLGAQEMIVITPKIKSSDNVVRYTFAPIVVTGSVRDKALKRAMNLGNFQFDQQPQVIVRNNNKTQTIPLTLDIIYREWLDNSQLVFEENVTGCACKDLFNDEYIALVIPAPFTPQYQLSYITPPVEEVKQRSETYSAHINFVVNRYEIRRDFKNNAQVLDEVDKIIREIRNDENLTVSRFQVTGYASPEGNYQSNMTLSKNRAESFVTYLMQNYQIGASGISTDWKGEDWEGLRKVVAESYSGADKDQVLQIIDNESNIAQRKNRLHQLSGGQTYRLLLNEYYPPLRRNDYTISYVARPFSIEEAKIQIRTKPQHLSLNEMFLVANSYPKNSQEFKEVFDIAVRQYPDSPIAQLNTAASEIETGNYYGAISRLEKINTPEALNNIGYAYTQLGEYDKALQYFNRAAQAGLSSATTNAEQLTRFMNETQYSGESIAF